MGRVLQALRRSRGLTAAEDRESRAVFALATGSADGDDQDDEEASVMTVAQLRLCLRALGFALARGEARALVYEFDFDSSETLRLADFQRVFLFKVLERGARQRFDDAFSALAEGGASVRVCDLVASNKDMRVAKGGNDDEGDAGGGAPLDADVFARHLEAQYYASDVDDAIASEADAMRAAETEPRVSRDALALFLRIE